MVQSPRLVIQRDQLTLSLGNSRNHRWTPDEQSYPQLRRQLIDQPARVPSKRGRNLRSDRMPLKPVKTVWENLWGFSKPRQGSVPTGVTDCPEEMGKMRPVRMQKKSRNQSERSIVSWNDLSGRVAVGATLPAVLAGDAAVCVMPSV